MKKLATSIADRLIGTLVPRTEASALWIYQRYCTWNPYCDNGQGVTRPAYVRVRCHDGSGECFFDAWLGCC